MLRTHRGRLTLAAATASGVLLAVVFVGIVLGARAAALSQRQAELQSALNALAGDPDRFEVDEFRESHPEMSMRAFDASGRTVAAIGGLPLRPKTGFIREDFVISIGQPRGNTLVVVGANWLETERGLTRLGLVLGLLWLPLTFLCGAVTWLTARAAFRPLDRLSAQAEAIGRSNLRERLQTEDHAEFGALAEQLNRMLDRIEASVKREERFASDAAHELRTPLAILRVRVESTLMRRRTQAEYLAAQKDVLAELERLSRIVESLLQTTRIREEDGSACDVQDVVRKTAARWQDRYVADGVELSVRVAPGAAKISEEELSIVLDNLLDNALRYSAAGMRVEISERVAMDWVEIMVTDGGPGIDPSIAARVFDRFVRADDDRNRASGGAGIGLSVCRGIVKARGGEIEVVPTGGVGSGMRFTLPRDAGVVETRSGARAGSSSPARVTPP
ncbi:MAG TPA: HAMP domain-containing sensor histidine kinase [Fimbriimonadaceae bacterium]|nr:HAMP domain-containing sensor histidine kinase [Fimbriimonadaceae bacterium]